MYSQKSNIHYSFFIRYLGKQSSMQMCSTELLEIKRSVKEAE